jgi:hypothetical protein
MEQHSQPYRLSRPASLATSKWYLDVEDLYPDAFGAWPNCRVLGTGSGSLVTSRPLSRMR